MRFTIRFNHDIPRHRKTAELLNAAGRKKAHVIADALNLIYKWEDGDGVAFEVVEVPAPKAISKPAPNVIQEPVEPEEVHEDDDNDFVLDMSHIYEDLNLFLGNEDGAQ